MPSDGQAVYKDYLVIHHSTGPEFVNSPAQEVADWYNAIGKSRGYAGIAHSGHYDPRTGQETFAQAQYTLHRKDGTPRGWELVELIADPFNNTAWGAGNWSVNQRCINIEVCGLFLDHPLPEEALLCLADFARPWDRRIVADGHPDGLQIFGHRAFYATQCPGQIYDQVPHLIDLVNQSPAPAPTPAPSTKAPPGT